MPIEIRKEIARASGHEPTRGAFYTTLDRLEAKGLVRWTTEAGSDGRDPSVRSFQKQWGDPPVVVAFHAMKQPERDWGPAARR